MNRTALLALSLLLPGLACAQERREPDMCLVPPGAQPRLPAKLLAGQGTTNMPVTTRSDEARAFFNQGISQLHSFWAVEAERSFLQAATLDPDMAMAWWGIAASAAGDHRAGFQNRRAAALREQAPKEEKIARTDNGAAIDGQVRAREAIAQAMALRDKVTPRERLYIEAQAARRNPRAKDPDADYIAGLRKLVAAHPDDLEAKSFLGLALLLGYELPSHQPRPGTLEGVRLLEEVVAANDGHFGAHHYLIHGYEGSATPEKAWRACERYPQLVTNIPHALHMPGHIFAQSDRIDDAVLAFTSAAANELGYLNADLLYANGHHGHNVHFLIHSLNLEGRYTESMLQARSLLGFKETPRESGSDTGYSTYRQGYFALVKTLVRFERWPDILDGRTIPAYEKNVLAAWRTWAMGLAWSATGNVPAARESLKSLREAATTLKAGPESPLGIAITELNATLDARNGDLRGAWKQFRDAADREAAMVYSEPPPYPRPVVEAWGNLASELKDFDAADRAYAEALVREPGSGRAYLGRAAALRALGKSTEANEQLEHARVAWNNADPQLPEMAPLRPVTAPASAAN
jgi:tetratricopeptide (TPR) repeat protein